eukprot:CAMPEP_0205953730 /NCGR_PEP_ID=MMETSP1459-20131121/19572_1 /ASSEMBLY_ACC=CAM_ASM_001120 /TAXON_ID=41880 /ORGANISM="Pycnococcus provasolii, Strain RCC931" /LENGTH=55 /DNA_ID=CAMNT_0053325865 /DNA_START=111 /DNA_END=274 /DNA_ORIENTATION=-
MFCATRTSSIFFTASGTASETSSVRTFDAGTSASSALSHAAGNADPSAAAAAGVT